MAVQLRYQHKPLRVSGVATLPAGATEMSPWLWDGDPSGGVAPTSWANPDNTVAGGLMQAAVAAPYTQQWLHELVLQGGLGMGPVRGIFYDRLGHCGGLSGTVTTAQNVNGGPVGALTRWSPAYAGAYANPDAVTGDGNEILLEVYTAIGGTPATATAIYTNSAGLAGQVTQAVTINHTAYSITRLPLAQGDTGVQSVTSVTLSGSTGTAGNFGITVAHRLASILPGYIQPEALCPTLSSGGAIEILSGACLWWGLLFPATPAANLMLYDAVYTIVDA